MHGRIRNTLVLIFFALMFVFAGTNAYLTLAPFFKTSMRGWAASEEGGVVRVKAARQDGPAAILKAGDEVVAVRGERGESLDPLIYPWEVMPGYAYTVEARRDGATQTFELRTVGYMLAHWLAMLVGSLLGPAVFVTTGFVLFILKPDDARARLLSLMFGSVILGAGAYSFDAVPGWLAWEMAIANTLSSLLSAIFLHFFLIFPETSPALRRWPRLRFALYVPSLVTIVPWMFVYMTRWMESPEVAMEFGETHSRIQNLVSAVDVAYFVAGLVSLAVTYKLSSALSRRKARVVLAGSVLGCVPWLAFSVIMMVVERERFGAEVFSWMLLGAWLPLLLLPAVFTYAIARHQIIPVSLLIRRSVRYVFISRGFVVVESFAAFAVLSFFLMNERLLTLDGVMPQLHTIIAIVATGLTVGLLSYLHERVMPRIDRRFFREAYDAQCVLSELGSELNATGSATQALQIVADKIRDTLHVECVTAFLRDQKSNEYVAAASSFAGEAGRATDVSTGEGIESGAAEMSVATPSLPCGALTIQLLGCSTRPLVVNATDSQSWLHARLSAKVEGNGRRQELETLKASRAALLIPLATKEGLCGILALGPKLSELPYSVEDCQLLMSVAWQATFAVENIRLVEVEREKDEQLLQGQKMQAVGQLAGGVAHDFNNLLTAINGYSDLALRRMPEGAPLRRNFEEIRKAGGRAAGLTRQLLAFSRKQVLQPVVFNLNNAVAEMEKMLERLIGEDVDLLTVLDPGLGQIKADPGQVEQVVMNLAVNARDAMPKGGRLTIQTSSVYLDEKYTRHHMHVQPGHYAMLAVSDTGHGIDAETRARIFEPFFTTKGEGKGTGLGLSTVYGVVQQSGGHIWVYSEVGRGTTFKIYMPLVGQPADDVRKTGGLASEPPRGTETILLVEDEELVRRMTREILETSGYEVLEARHGIEAAEVAERYAGHIHLLLTDVVMPHMSGRELAEQLATLRPDTSVLYMSGYTDDAIVRHGVLEHGVAFLEKPFTPDTLARKVRSVIDESIAMHVTLS